ncbi:hypothetical protein ACFRKB_35200 [Streptomyces scopuliridis]|uniref:hypothetical protein n=1 Tax=Streptomyces scopuliridis TaxID=452529 RepID=UPI0036756646
MLAEYVNGSPKIGEVVARHMSKKQKDRGIMITLQTTRWGQKFGLWMIDRIPGLDHLTCMMVDLLDTEDEARKLANEDWVGMGL